MQFQADLLGVPVVRPAITETTALGAAYLAGLATGFWKSTEEISARWRIARRFEPSTPREMAAIRMHEWSRAVERSLGWASS
jgi:glycerol kinase